MDALEARMQFIHVLKALPKTLDVSRRGPGTSRTPESAAEAGPGTGTGASASGSPTLFYMAHYAEHYEDLQQCMMDAMNKMDVLDRLYMAIYYHRLVEELSAAAAGSATATKVLSQVLLPTLPRVYELACPLEHPQALTNQPELLQLFEELKRELGDRAAECATVLAEVQLYLDRTQELKQRLMDQFARTGTLGTDPSSPPLPSQIALNRMEMDRDRHKKQKEQSWHVHRAADPLHPEVNGMLLPREFDALWDATPALTPSDARDAAELHAIAAASYRAD